MDRWTSVILKLGVPAAIALWVVYWLTTTVDAKLDAIAAQGRDQIAVAMRLQESYNVHNVATASQVAISRQICINTARNDEQRRECVK